MRLCSIFVATYRPIYGGKNLRRLDRQHPRDLFDVTIYEKMRVLLMEIKKGFPFLSISKQDGLYMKMFIPKLIGISVRLWQSFDGWAMNHLPNVDFGS